MLLIVDDDPAFLNDAQYLLADSCRHVYFAANARQAWSLMATVGADFSVVMVDLDLPGDDGFSLIRELRRRFPDLPVIAISGVYQKDVLESAKVLGAVETLQKPVTSEWRSTIARVRAKSAGA
jgi:CheY-like chemotaxis protein